MDIRIIDTIESYERLKEDWNEIYASDPHTTIFVSWEWLRGWVEITPYRWFIAAVRDGSSYVAFMPFALQSVMVGRFKTIQKLYLGGYPWSDNTGFICKPGYEDKAVGALADFMKEHLKWNSFFVRNAFDPRLGSLIETFPRERFSVHDREKTICPYIPLPASWENYLMKSVSGQMRRHIRHKTQGIEQLDGFRLVETQAGTLESQTDALLMLWLERWGKKPDDILNSYRTLFRYCFENNSLWLMTIWNGRDVVAGLAGFLDRKNRVFAQYTPVFNKDYAKLSPGLVLMGYSIRYAIENGFVSYDFGAGDEDYKSSFGTTERVNRNVIVNRMAFLDRAKNMIPASVRQPLKEILTWR